MATYQDHDLPEINPGYQGESVRVLQALLKAAGCPGSWNANYEETTQNAVLKFKQQQSLSGGTTVGHDTWHQLATVAYELSQSNS